MKLTPRLALTFVIYAAALLAGVGLLAYSSGRAALHSATISELSATAIEKQSALNEWVEDKKMGIALLAADPAAIESAAALVGAPPGSAQAQAAHDKFVQEIQPHAAGGQFLAVMLIDPRTGEVIAATDPNEEGKFKEDRPFFIHGRTAPYVQNVYYALALQGPAMTASAPLKGPAGQLLGVLAGRINLEEMNSIINRRSGLRETDDAFLVNTSNLFVTQPYLVSDPAVLQRGVHTEGVNRCLTRTSGTLEADDYRGVPTVIVYRWLPERELCLLVKIDQTEAYAPARAFGAAVAAISTLALLVAAVLAVGLARGLTRPILALQAGAARFGRGQLDSKLPEDSRDELGALAREFNQMAASLLEKDAELRAYARTLEQKVQERTKELQESEARYRGLMESQLDLIVRVDLEGRFTFVNDAYCQKFGLKREEIVGRASYQPLVHPEDLPHTLEAMQALYRPPYRAIMEQRAFTVEGLRWIEWQDSAIRDETGTIVEIQAIGRDITARRQAEAALRQSEQRLKRAQEIAHLGSWELNLVDNQLTWSDEVYRIFGLEPQEFGATYQAFLEAVHPDDRAAVDAAYSGSLREGMDGYEIEHRVFRRPNGEIRIVHEKCEHFRNEDGQIIRSSGMVHDITERKRAEEAIQHITDDLLRSNAELEQFAYVASHDLQEPLRMISSYVQLLAKRYQGRLDSDADEFIAFAVEGATRMQNLINDLLTYSRVGMRGNSFTPVSAEYLLEEALSNLQLTIQESGAQVTHDPLPVVKGDSIQLMQVFQNLLGNAIKFHGTEPPCVHMSARQAGAEWIFSVRDNGIGIDPKFAERIFVIFQRLHDRSAYPGTGIGLAVCKRIIQRHGGRIWVESQPGKGSIFYFSLPGND